MINFEELKKEHFTFKAGGQTPVNIKEKGAFDSIAYSGGVITEHWYWDRVIIDLDSMTIPGRIPALFEHYSLVGKCKEVVKSNSLAVSGYLFTEKASAKAGEIRNTSDEGHEWEMSIRPTPKTRRDIEEIEPGVEVTVNGASHMGPLVVFRNTRLTEVSFVLFGADTETQVTVFKRGDEPKLPTNPGGKPKMDTEKDIKELKESFSALAKTNADLIATGKASAERADGLEKQLAEFKAGVRKGKVEELFSKLGMDQKDEDMKTYIDMDETVFSAVSAHMIANKPSLPDEFSMSVLSDKQKSELTAKGNPLIADAEARAEV